MMSFSSRAGLLRIKSVSEEVSANRNDEVSEGVSWYGECVLEPVEHELDLPSDPNELVSVESRQQLARDLEALARQRRYVAMNPGIGLVRRSVVAVDLAKDFE